MAGAGNKERFVMKLEFDSSGRIIIDPFLLLNYAIVCAEEDIRDNILQSLACDERVIKHIADQIIDGWTENGSHGSLGFREEVPSTALELRAVTVCQAL